MPTRRNTLIALAAVAAAATSVGYAMLKGGFIHLDSGPAIDLQGNPIVDWRNEADKAFEPFESVPFSQIQSASDVSRIRPRVEVIGSPPPQTSTDQLLHEVDEFLAARFVNPDRDRYAEWNLARGETFEPLESMQQHWLLKEFWPAMFNEPMPEGLTTRDAFNTLWDYDEQQRTQAQSFVAIVDSPETWAVAYTQQRRPEDPATRVRTATISDDLFYGSVAGTHRRWWKLAHPPAELMKQRGVVNTAEVAFIVEAPDVRIPMVLKYYWDPIDNRWVRQDLRLHNLGVERREWTVIDH